MVKFYGSNLCWWPIEVWYLEAIHDIGLASKAARDRGLFTNVKQNLKHLDPPSPLC